MHGRKIFAVLSLVLLSFQTKASIVNHVSVGDMGGPIDTQPRIESLFQGLLRSVASEKSQQAKVAKVRMTLNQITDIRREGDVMNLDQEIYFDFLTNPLAQFFDHRFNASKCLEFDHIIKRDFEPTAEALPANPPVRKSYELIAAVCSESL